MRNIACILSLLLLLVVSCTDGWRSCMLSGSGVGVDDTLYLYGLDRRYEYVDTIVADGEGRYEYNIPVDTLSPMALLMPSGEDIVLFAEPDNSLQVAPDTLRRGRWMVRGGVAQQQYDSMAIMLDALGEARRIDKITDFVKNNPLNEIGIILVRRYMVEVPSPDMRNVREVMGKFGGRLQDNDYVADYKKTMEQKRSITNTLHSSVPVFDYLNVDDSTRLNNGRYRDKYWVINFWASWDTLSRQHLREISSICKRYDNDLLTMLNISLDHDTAAWRNAVVTDSICGDNACDRKMWGNALVKRYNVNSLPFSVLVNPQLLNIEFDVTPEKLNASIDSLIKKQEQRLKKLGQQRKKKK